VKDLKPAMKANIVRLLRTSPDRVNVKARTHEKVMIWQCKYVVLCIIIIR